MKGSRLFNKRELTKGEASENFKANAMASYSLRQAVKETGCSMAEIAAQIPVSANTFYRYVAKPDEMPIKVLRRLKKVLNIDEVFRFFDAYF